MFAACGPGLLTTDICSLRGKVERLTFSVIWEMTPSAEIVDTSFTKAIHILRSPSHYMMGVNKGIVQ